MAYSRGNTSGDKRNRLIIGGLSRFALLYLLLFAVTGCDDIPAAINTPGYYVYYFGESPFGFLEVTELGGRSDAGGRLTLLKYEGFFRFSDGAERDYPIKMITASRDDGRLAYVCFDDGETVADVRYGGSSVHYAVRGDNRNYSREYEYIPAFLRYRNVYMPIPFSEQVGFYPTRLQALNLENGAEETVSCRTISVGRIYLDFRGYAATLAVGEDGRFEGLVCSDSVAIKREEDAPSRDLTAFNPGSQAIALPFVVEDAAEIGLPLSVNLSRPFDPNSLDESFKGECLGDRAVGEFFFSTPARTERTIAGFDDAPAVNTYECRVNGSIDDLYCCGLELAGGNLLYPVYWREPPGEAKGKETRILLARSAEPVRVVTFDVTEAPRLSAKAVRLLGESAFSISPKEPLVYDVFFEGEPVGDLVVAGYRRRGDGSLYFRTAGDVFGAHVISSSPASLGNNDGTALRPASLTLFHPEAFLAIGTAMADGTTGRFPRSFFVPAPGASGFVRVEFSSVASYPVGATSKTCYVYDCGGTRVAFDKTGVPARIESGDFVLVLTHEPKLIAARPRGYAKPLIPEVPGTREDASAEAEVPE